MAIQIGQSLAAGILVDAERCSISSGPGRDAYSSCRGTFSAATAEIRNDELLLTRQARELARQAALIGALEGDLASASRSTGVSTADIDCPIVERPPEAVALEAAGQQRPDRQIGLPTSEQFVIEKLDIHPTVYTNLGSLLDVFA